MNHILPPFMLADIAKHSQSSNVAISAENSKRLTEKLKRPRKTKITNLLKKEGIIILKGQFITNDTYKIYYGRRKANIVKLEDNCIEIEIPENTKARKITVKNTDENISMEL